jgi:hypothetical protein
MSSDYRYTNENFDNQFYAVYQCYSAAFLNDRERTNIENGGKILLPQSALEQLVEQVENSSFISIGIFLCFFSRHRLCYLN